MRQVGDVPAQVEVRMLDRSQLQLFARRHLPGFRDPIVHRKGSSWSPGIGLAHLLDDCVGLHIAHHHQEAIVRGVVGSVIRQQVVSGDAIEEVQQSDDRIAVGTLGVGGRKKPLAGAAARIVFAHVHLAPDDIEFLLEFIGRQRRVLEDVAENIDGRGGPRVRHIDPIHGAVEARVRIHVAARRLDLLVDATGAPGGGSLEEHVFEHVGQAGPQPLSLIDAAGAGPRLHAHDRG